MTDTTEQPQPTIRERLQASTDPQFWARTFLKHAALEERNNEAMMTRAFGDAIEVGRRDGQQNPGGHGPGEVQQAIIQAFTDGYTAMRDELPHDLDLFLAAAEPAMKRFMAFVTGRKLIDDLPAPDHLFDQDADEVDPL